MPRLFTGLEVPRPVSTVLAGLRGGLSGARWIAPDDYHLTLRFFGDVDRDCAQALDDLIAQMRHEPFRLTISGLHIFGRDKPRALVAAITPHKVLTELQTEQERLARRLGLEAETRKFTPHITLARLRDVSAYQVAAFLSMLGPLPPLSFAVDRCVMFSARDQVGGGPYVVEAVYPFAGTADEDWAHAERA